MICYIIEVEKKIIIENQQLYTVCYQCAKDLLSSVVFFINLVSVFAFLDSIIVPWICVSCGESVIV